MNDYFNGTESIYDEKQFARRFRMPREVFNRIKDRIIGQGTFVDKVDMFGNPTIRPLVLLVACLDHYAFGTAADHADAPYAIAESTLNQSAKEFCALMIASFGNEYLCRIPSVQERARILSINEERGFPGMFASWDCKHFGWQMCPMAHRGQYHNGKEKGPSLVLEAICGLHQSWSFPSRF